MKQTTIGKSIDLVGIGLHKGVPVKLKLNPMPQNSGINFKRSDKDISIKVDPSFVVDTKMATVLGVSNVVISTIEHLLSAVSGYGIDNLEIEVDNDEVPIMEGSAAAFYAVLEEAGLKELDAKKRFIKLKKTVTVTENDKFVSIEPNDICRYEYKITFAHPAIGTQSYAFDFTKQNYKNEIARARTFGFLQEVHYLHSIGLAKGASLQNAIALDDTRILNPEGLRFKDEFVRHKILDAVGDMVFLGAPFIGTYKSFAGSHKLNHLLTVEILKDSSAYEIVEF